MHRLLTDPALASRARLWPFETAWDAAVERRQHRDRRALAEPGGLPRQPYPIKDACQVAAVRDWALDEPDGARATLARPADLTAREERTAREIEGWIAGNVCNV